MRRVVVIADDMEHKLRTHLFQNKIEQGAFLFGRVEKTASELRITATDAYLVPPKGWEVQHEVYLQMQDNERAKIMKMARTGNFSLIDCHSHPDSGPRVAFSPSDVTGISEFAAYVKWKLGNKPYIAMVWGETSVDAVIWEDDFTQAHPVSELLVVGFPPRLLVPRGTWFKRPAPYWRDRTGY